jgi:crotonobetainyl-CoA:carnitine CoA-transferase CaiB-like acyl-CoA transferase
MSGPLSHIRVLDLSRVLAGPWAAQNLADLGAQVIKVERPISGDDTRVWGPPFLNDAQTGERADAAYFMTCNRGKQSITVDIDQRISITQALQEAEMRVIEVVDAVHQIQR